MSRMYFQGVVGVKGILEQCPLVEGPAGGSYEDCRCRIHRKLELGNPGLDPGCMGVRVGTHHAIAALYDKKGERRYCHVEAGQRRLDEEFFSFLSGANVGANAYVDAAGWAPAKKYETGFDLDVEQLGAGFCYVVGLRSKVRMRVARVLGPMPLVVEVLRVVRVVGVAEGPQLRVDCVGPGKYHVYEDKGRPADAYAGQRFLQRLVQVLYEAGPEARVGVSPGQLPALTRALAALGLRGSVSVGEELGDDTDSDDPGPQKPVQKLGQDLDVAAVLATLGVKFEPFDSGQPEISQEVREVSGSVGLSEAVELTGEVVGPSVGPGKGKVVDRGLGVRPSGRVETVRYGGWADVCTMSTVGVSAADFSSFACSQRAVKVRDWLSAHGVDKVPKIAWLDLAVVSTAPVAMPQVLWPLKERVKLFAVMGDVAMKVVTVGYVMSNMGSGAEYTRLQQGQRNTDLIKYAEVSGLLKVFDLGPTKKDSKVVADMVEAVVGVVAYFRPFNTVVALINSMGLVPKRTGPAYVHELKWQTTSEVLAAEDEELFRQFLEFKRGLGK